MDGAKIIGSIDDRNVLIAASEKIFWLDGMMMAYPVTEAEIADLQSCDPNLVRGVITKHYGDLTGCMSFVRHVDGVNGVIDNYFRERDNKDYWAKAAEKFEEWLRFKVGDQHQISNDNPLIDESLESKVREIGQ